MLSEFFAAPAHAVEADRIEPSDAPLPPLDLSAFDAPSELRVLPIRFTASGAAYFRIWIVNLLLTVLSLGIFSAWAKVRREQYFHRHTAIDGAPLDYTAKPLRILRGRLIALVLFALWYCSDYFIRPVQITLVVLALASVPLLSWSALRFRCANTRWRGIPFHFDGRLGDLYGIWLRGAIRVVLTLGLGLHRLRRNLAFYTISKLGYGNQKGHSTLDENALRSLYLGTLGLSLIGTIAAGILTVVATSVSRQNPYAVAAVSFLGFGGVYQLAFARIAVLRANKVGSTSRIGCVRFEVSIPFSVWLRTLILGLLFCLLSLGLYWPWLAIALRRIRLENTVAKLEGSLSVVSAIAPSKGEAAADAAADWFDFDFGL